MSQWIEIPLFGPINRATSLSPDSSVGGNESHADYSDFESLWNMMPIPDQTGQVPAVLAPFPGLSQRAQVKSAGDLNGRALTTYADPNNDYEDRLACIINNSFYYADNSSATSFSSPGTITSAIDTGFGDMTMLNFQSGSSSQIVWSNHRSATSGVGYYDPITDTQDVASVIGSGFAAGSPNSIAYMNRQLLGEDGEGWATSAPASLQLDTTNRAAEAEASPDRVRRIIAGFPYIYVMGSRTTEVYQNTGSGKPPFSRLPTGVINVGVKETSAATFYNGVLYFIDNQNRPSAIIGTEVRQIGNRYINRLLGTAITSDSKILCFNQNGTDIVLFCLRRQVSASSITDGMTLAFYPEFGLWGRLGDPTATPGSDAANIWKLSNHAQAGLQNFFLGQEDGYVYVMSNSVQQYDGTNHWTKERTTAPVNSRSLGAGNNQWVYMSSLEMYTSPGSNLNSSSITMSYSDDGGETWSTEQSASLGGSGDYGQKILWSSLGRFKNRAFRFRHATDATNTPLVPFLRIFGRFSFGAP